MDFKISFVIMRLKASFTIKEVLFTAITNLDLDFHSLKEVTVKIEGLMVL